MIRLKKWLIDLSIYITLNQNNNDCMVGKLIKISIFRMLLLEIYKKLNLKFPLIRRKKNKNKTKQLMMTISYEKIYLKKFLLLKIKINYFFILKLRSFGEYF